MSRYISRQSWKDVKIGARFAPFLQCTYFKKDWAAWLYDTHDRPLLHVAHAPAWGSTHGTFVFGGCKIDKNGGRNYALSFQKSVILINLDLYIHIYGKVEEMLTKLLENQNQN
jgi:hypothetical protein